MKHRFLIRSNNEINYTQKFQPLEGKDSGTLTKPLRRGKPVQINDTE